MLNHFEVQELNNVTIVRLGKRALSRWDEQISEATRRYLLDAITTGKKNILLNFTEVEHMGSMGKGILTVVNRKIRQAGGQLVMCHVNEDILETWRILKIYKLFNIVTDEAAALEVFRQQECEEPVILLRQPNVIEWP